jgi:hypothetical protein
MADRPDLPIPDSYWVKPGRFLAGEYPGRPDGELTRRRIDAFLEAGFNTFIDLTHAGELPAYDGILEEQARAYHRDVSYTRMPILDHAVPTPEMMKSILDRIDHALADDNKVYLHCWGGVGRTGTTIGCYLIRHGLTSRQALQQIAGWWLGVPKHVYFPRSPETEEQVRFVLDWEETNPRTE